MSLFTHLLLHGMSPTTPLAACPMNKKTKHVEGESLKVKAGWVQGWHVVYGTVAPLILLELTDTIRCMFYSAATPAAQTA